MLVPEPLRAHRGWPEKVQAAPDDLVRLIEDAMIDFGPDGHCDGADIIAALAAQWMRENGTAQP